MAKLFIGNENFQSAIEAFEERQFSSTDISDLKDAVVSMENLTSLFNKEEATIDIVKQLRYSTEKLSFNNTDERLLADNNLKLFEIIQHNLGINKTTMPSLEDFKCQFTRETSKEVSLEGFTDFIKRIWKVIKEFVVEFFKKIVLFFKRITGGRLNNEEIKAYIKKNFDAIRVQDLRVPIDSQTMIVTRLPSIFAKSNADKFSARDVETIGLGKIQSHLSYLSGLRKYYQEQLKKSQDEFKTLKELLVRDLNLTTSELSETEVAAKAQLAELREQHKQRSETSSHVEGTTISQDSYMEPIWKSNRENLSSKFSFESNDEAGILKEIIDMLEKSTLDQADLLIKALGLTSLTDLSIIPDKARTSLDGMTYTGTKDTVEAYYSYGNYESLLSNFNIFMKTMKGREELKSPVSGVTQTDEVNLVPVSALKVAASTCESKILSNELGVVVKLGVLIELFEKAKLLETSNVKETVDFVEKISTLVIKQIKELEQIFDSNKVSNKAGELIRVLEECKNLLPDGEKEAMVGRIESVKKHLTREAILSAKFAKAGHNTLIDLSRELTAKLTTINHDTATEIYNYVYKCTKEYK